MRTRVLAATVALSTLAAPAFAQDAAANYLITGGSASFSLSVPNVTLSGPEGAQVNGTSVTLPVDRFERDDVNDPETSRIVGENTQIELDGEIIAGDYEIGDVKITIKGTAGTITGDLDPVRTGMDIDNAVLATFTVPAALDGAKAPISVTGSDVKAGKDLAKLGENAEISAVGLNELTTQVSQQKLPPVQDPGMPQLGTEEIVGIVVGVLALLGIIGGLGFAVQQGLIQLPF